MQFLKILPSPALSGIVQYFWVSSIDKHNEAIFTYYSIAEASAKLVFMYPAANDGLAAVHSEFYSALQGQTQTHQKFPAPGLFNMFGVSLQPAAIPKLCGFSATEINDITLDLPTLFGHKGKELDEKMRLAVNTSEQLQIISSFLQNQLEQNSREELVIDSAIKDIRSKAGRVEISDLAKTYFLSQKQFKRKFREWSGFTPKKFARITRFETAVGSYQSAKSLTEMAYSCGYYDQSHFIRDFKEFTGYSPGRYFHLAEGQL